MRFGIDLDGCLADFSREFVKTVNQLWPGKLPPEYVPETWLYEGALLPEELPPVFARIRETSQFWEKLHPLPGIEELQNYLVNWPKEPEIFFITARMDTVGKSPLVQTSRWLEWHSLWPREGHSTIIPVAEAKHKQDLFRGLGLKFFLDDYAPTVEQLNQIDGMHAYVLDQPWNRYATDLPRVFSVTEYLDTIRKF